MIIDIIQNNKDLCEADFDIVSNNKIIGAINVQGKLYSNEAIVKGNFNNISFELSYNGVLTIKNINGKFRPYKVLELDRQIGEIYTEYKKAGLFSDYSYTTLVYNDEVYKKYNIGLGKESVDVIYLNDEQIAQIDRSLTIYNDLYNFKLYFKDEKYSVIPILFSCYMYVTNCFVSGQKSYKAVKKLYNKTTIKELVLKYDPEWIKDIKDV